MDSHFSLQLSNQVSSYFTWLTILVLTVILFWYLIISALRILIPLKKKYVFLEIKSTDRALKSPLSTNQLFTALHSLQKPHIWWQRLFGVKTMISLEIVSNKNDGIRYIFRLPEELSSITRKTLLAYLPGIEVREVGDYLDENFTSDSRSTIRELILKKSFIFPIQEHLNLELHDPIAYITAQMTKLTPDERIALQVICNPIHGLTHPRSSNYVYEINTRLLNNEDLLKFLNRSSILEYLETLSLIAAFICLTPLTLTNWLISKSNNPLPTWLFAHQEQGNRPQGKNSAELHSQIAHKVSQSLFECTIRVCITSRNSGKRLQGITSSVAVFNTPNQAFKLKLSLGSLLKSNTIQKLYRYCYQQRLSVQSNVILSIGDLTSLYHFPYTLTTKTEDLLLVKSPSLPPPLSLKKSNTELDITFAANTYGETTVPIGLTLEERRRHVYIIGATGTGKTTILQHMIHQDLNKGNGLAVIDPHGDLSEKLLGIIPENRIEDVVYFDPYDIEYPIGLNVLEIPPGLTDVELQREKDFITSTLISIFHKLYDARYSGPRMEHILRNVVLTALELENPTLFTVYRLLTDKKYRKEITSELKDEILSTFWKNEFDKLGSFQKAEMISPITNKLGRFYTTGITRNILNQPKSKLNFDQILNEGKILICNLSKGKIGEDTAYFLGSLLTAKIQLTALRRVHIQEDKRKDFFLYIDEFQNFATMSFAQVLSEARKYRLGVILAHQNTVQIEKDLLETIIGNTGTIVSFRTTSPTDEYKLLPIFTPEVDKGQIANLPSYHFYIKINALQPQATFSGKIENFNIPHNLQIKTLVLQNSRANFANHQKIQKAKTQIKTTTVISKPKLSKVTNLFEAIQP